ncbi:hypothetical protein WR25_27227 [Diploscapter pachys]|uniref:PPM-type phosphatase domain-containing protein n=1 Tax=Diploscapter pachys TaxID=2018661 RepID=A0A2A2JS77_9BILA|nr:hypothetical protein WR25_27227 [Diploscapter pachys]
MTTIRMKNNRAWLKVEEKNGRRNGRKCFFPLFPVSVFIFTLFFSCIRVLSYLSFSCASHFCFLSLSHFLLVVAHPTSLLLPLSLFPEFFVQFVRSCCLLMCEPCRRLKMSPEGLSTRRRPSCISLQKNDRGRAAISKSNHFGTNLRVSVAASQGGRRYMEDRVMLETARNPDGSIKFSFFGIFDGHGGSEASEFVRAHLLKNIISNSLFESDDDNDILEAIRQGFLETHDKMRAVVDLWPRTASGYSSTAGTTASVVFVRNGKLYVGHVGDSAIYLGRNSEVNGNTRVTVETLTVDHKPERDEEKARIMEAGGAVAEKCGVVRVVWTRPIKGHSGPVRRSTPTERIPFLAVARSLGDLWSYCEATQTFAVSPEPDLEVIQLTGEEMFIVLASDGLTNVMAPLQLMAVVDEQEQINKQAKENDKGKFKYVNHSRVLLGMALDNWRTLRADNVSVLTVMFDEEPYCQNDLEGEPLDWSTVSFYDALRHYPRSIISVSDFEMRRIRTKLTPVIYTGAKDYNFFDTWYRGAGFVTHEDERIQNVMRMNRAVGGFDEDGNMIEDEEDEEKDELHGLRVAEEQGNEDFEIPTDTTPLKRTGLYASAEGNGNAASKTTSGSMFELPPTIVYRPVHRAPLHSVIAPFRDSQNGNGISSMFSMEGSASYSLTAASTSVSVSRALSWRQQRVTEMEEEGSESDEEEPKKGNGQRGEVQEQRRAEGSRTSPRKRRSATKTAELQLKLTSPIKRCIRKRESGKVVRCITPDNSPISPPLTEFQRLTRSATRSSSALTSPIRAKAGPDNHNLTHQITPKKKKTMSREIAALFDLQKKLPPKNSYKEPLNKVDESAGRVTRSQSSSFVAATPSPVRILAHPSSRLKRSTPVSACSRANKIPKSNSDQAVPTTPESVITSRPSALTFPSSAVLFATPPTTSLTSQFAQPLSTNLLGSRKRPHQLIAVPTPQTRASSLVSTGATPALLRMSFSSPTGTKSSPTSGLSSPKIHSAPVTPSKISDCPVSSSRWSLNRLHSSPNSSSYSDSAALFNSSSTTDADEQPPSKIRRFYGFVRRLVGFDGDS